MAKGHRAQIDNFAFSVQTEAVELFVQIQLNADISGTFSVRPAKAGVDAIVRPATAAWLRLAHEGSVPPAKYVLDAPIANLTHLGDAPEATIKSPLTAAAAVVSP